MPPTPTGKADRPPVRGALLLRGVMLCAAAGVLACGAPVAPPAAAPPPEVAEAPAEAFTPLPQLVWTAAPEAPIRQGESATALPRPLTRLDVLGREEDGSLLVECAYCDPPVVGEVWEADVLREAQPPAAVAEGSIGPFALAVRDAAAWRRIDTLLPVMAEDFTFGFSAQRDRALAPRAWEWDGYRNLDQVARLIDEGLVSIGPDFWVAPAAYAERPGYPGLRLGFRRNPETGRWEWLFLVRGE